MKPCEHYKLVMIYTLLVPTAVFGTAPFYSVLGKTKHPCCAESISGEELGAMLGEMLAGMMYNLTVQCLVCPQCSLRLRYVEQINDWPHNV